MDLFCACWRCALRNVSRVAGFRKTVFLFHGDAREACGLGRDGRLEFMHGNHRHLAKSVLVDGLNKIHSFPKKRSLAHPHLGGVC